MLESYKIMIERIDELADETLNEDGPCCSDTNCCPPASSNYKRYSKDRA